MKYYCPVCKTKNTIKVIEERDNHFGDFAWISAYVYKCSKCRLEIKSRWWGTDEKPRKIMKREKDELKGKLKEAK